MLKDLHKIGGIAAEYKSDNTIHFKIIKMFTFCIIFMGIKSLYKMEDMNIRYIKRLTVMCHKGPLLQHPSF